MNFAANVRLIKTLADIGPFRLQRRLRYDLRQRLDRLLSPRFALAWAGGRSITPQWLPVLRSLELMDMQLPVSKPPQKVSFGFLQQEQQLLWPIRWNDPNWPRLWQFHLHYFDWARDWLELTLATGEWPDKAALLESLMDQWIEVNPPGRGDGWHSYTLSLRSRNWIWLFRSCPQLATPSRIQSLWHQLCWLQAHPEHCHGGNHWLENLIALALGGLQFAGPKAHAMHTRAMRHLQKELSCQLLADGGHEERSSSYHLLMLDRLVELACALSGIHGERPLWLIGAIDAMTTWAKSVRLEGGVVPRFNDSPEDGSPSLDQVITFAEDYLQLRSPISLGFRKTLINVASITSIPVVPPLYFLDSYSQAVTDLAQTGWTILRPGHGWELVFKCGVPCPPHLPSHVHSDQLSFEICHHGRWVLSEVGTSIYGSGPDRAYERSGAAHNVLQLGREFDPGVITWIEPVDVWGSFRAGRKSQPQHRRCGQISSDIYFASGSHNGYKHIGASHEREVFLSDAQSNQITFDVVDTIVTSSPLHVCQWWHLGPDFNRRLLNSLTLDAPTLKYVYSRWHSTWFSFGFGQRSARDSLSLRGLLPAGKHRIHRSIVLLSQQ